MEYRRRRKAPRQGRKPRAGRIPGGPLRRGQNLGQVQQNSEERRPGSGGVRDAGERSACGGGEQTDCRPLELQPYRP